MFEHLKARADRCAAGAARLRRERNAHARHGYDILRRRIGSPPGLVACFGAGVVAGARSHRRGLREYGEDRGNGRQSGADGGFAERALRGPLGAAAIRLGSAFLAGALLEPNRAVGGGTEPTQGG